jgi:competence ComEA-like helix-hairpin-helix protein
VTPLSADERRALALLAALLLLASAARWLERPRSILDDVPDVDIVSLEDASRAAKDERAVVRSPPKRTPPAASTGGATGGRSASGYTPAQRIDPNVATAEALTRLPGVGPALAARIIAERERAPFASVDDLRRVDGVGATLAARLAEHLALPANAAPPPRDVRASSTLAATSPYTGAASAEPIDLNTARAEQLERIAGIGPAIAARLVARRDSLGRFRSYDDVDAVAGVGPALLSRIRAATILR